jgi:RNA polymerase primary sigma factor
MVITSGLREETQRILATLVPKERKVLIRRFGFDTNKRYTLKSMGDEFGISAETVRQIEMKALKKLKDRYGYMREYLCQ